MNKKQITEALTTRFNKARQNLLAEARNEHIYYDDEDQKAGWWAISSKVLSKASSMGYGLDKLAGLIEIRGSRSRNELHLFELNSYDLKVPGVSDYIKPGMRVFRYMSDMTAAGGIAPMILYNFKRNLAYVNTDEAADMGVVKFETRGMPVKYARFTNEYEHLAH